MRYEFILPTILRRLSWWSSYLVWFCVFYYGAFMLSLALLFVFVLLFFSVCLALWSPRFGKRELVCVLLVHLFVYFAHVSLPLGVGGWLQLVIVALPGIFYLRLCTHLCVLIFDRVQVCSEINHLSRFLYIRKPNDEEWYFSRFSIILVDFPNKWIRR